MDHALGEPDAKSKVTAIPVDKVGQIELNHLHAVSPAL
jgi:hypothetical protein